MKNSEDIARISDQLVAEYRLLEFRLNMESRDYLVMRALSLGISKNRICTISGIARTTIDRIVEENSAQNSK
jgi:hypothetical protein